MRTKKKLKKVLCFYSSTFFSPFSPSLMHTHTHTHSCRCWWVWAPRQQHVWPWVCEHSGQLPVSLSQRLHPGAGPTLLYPCAQLWVFMSSVDLHMLWMKVQQQNLNQCPSVHVLIRVFDSFRPQYEAIDSSTSHIVTRNIVSTCLFVHFNNLWWCWWSWVTG